MVVDFDVDEPPAHGSRVSAPLLDVLPDELVVDALVEATGFDVGVGSAVALPRGGGAVPAMGAIAGVASGAGVGALASAGAGVASAVGAAA